MRYLYQQLLAFCGMVALILLIVGVSFTQLTKQTIEENNYQQLFGYAESVEKTTQTYADTLPQFSQDQAFQNALLLTEQVLTEQNVNFIFIDKNERVIYPTNTALLNFTLTADQWKNLRNGRQEKFTSSKNILGQAQATSYALVPFNLNHEFYGALVVSQPARNIDNSVRPITLNLFKGFIFSSIVAVIASYAFAAFQVKRINRLRNATKEVTNGNFDVQLPVHDKDEFDELADDFNKMTNAHHWSITAYSDFAYFAWPKYQTRESIQSWDNLVNILFQPSRVLTVGGRFRYKDKAGTTTGRLRLYATMAQKRWSAKTSFDYTMSQTESLMTNEGDELSKGYMVSEHIGWEWKWKQLKGTLRGCLGYFHTSDFASRIYAYEPGLLYQMSFGSYYGEGIRYALVARSEIGSHLLLIAKLGTTDYFDRSHISSGLQEISRSSQTDLEIQVKWKW